MLDGERGVQAQARGDLGRSPAAVEQREQLGQQAGDRPPFQDDQALPVLEQEPAAVDDRPQAGPEQGALRHRRGGESIREGAGGDLRHS